MPGEQKLDQPMSVTWLPWNPLTEPTTRRGPADLIGRHFLEVTPDLFGPDVTDDQRDAAFAAMMIHTRHIFRVVTSFPAAAGIYLRALNKANERISRLGPTVRDLDREFSSRFDAGVERLRTPPECWSHVWLMLRASTQADLDAGVPALLVAPAAVRGVLLDGPVAAMRLDDVVPTTDARFNALKYLRWIAIRGQTGPDAKPLHPDIVRSVRDQCQEATVPFCFEGWGEWSPREEVEATRLDPPDSLVYFPEIDLTCRRIGAEAAGRLLDGQIWEQFPEVAHAR